MADAAKKTLNNDSDNSVMGSVGNKQITQDGTGESYRTLEDLN